MSFVDSDVAYIILWVVLGLVMGFLARAILPGEQKIGLIPTMIVGVVGSFIGAFSAQQFFNVDVSGLHWQALLSALVGSIIALVVFCLIFRRNWR